MLLPTGPHGYDELETGKLDLRTARLAPWRTIRRWDPAGIRGLGSMRITRDGRDCAFTVWRVLTDLYLVECVNRCVRHPGSFNLQAQAAHWSRDHAQGAS